MSDSEIMEATKKFAAVIRESDTYREYLDQRENSARGISICRMNPTVRICLTGWRRLSRNI